MKSKQSRKKAAFKGLCIMVFLMIALPIAFYCFLYVVKSGINSVNVSVWVNVFATYIGACLGGIITYLSIYFTAMYYDDEFNQRMDEVKLRMMENNTRDENEKRKYYLDIKRQSLFSSRPYLILKNIGVEEKEKCEEIDRYVFVSNEKEWANLMSYSDENVKEVYFKIRNIGRGPAEKINFFFESSDYSIDGFNDREVPMNMDDDSVIYQKMSIDIANGEELFCKLKLHFSNKMIHDKKVYKMSLTLNLVYFDYLNNKIKKPISFAFFNDDNSILGVGPQKYCNDENQKIFEGTI
ncbi:hypothetical protein [Kandleria sp.]|uniref:hypothetical protein n=1 Tax=Kandleria sp. TaxID=2774291 RepID=UPI001B4A22A3|nr:hypothetical protein [Kandleria sp.]MBP3275782.1 hypothetical protein [Kandleria sp.]